MGPYSEERQYERAQAIARLLSDPNLNDEVRIIWERHLANLSRDESQYNSRVKQIYTEMRNRYTEKWI